MNRFSLWLSPHKLTFFPFLSNQPLEAFFKSAMAWEKNQTSGVRLDQEEDGVYKYKSESDHMGILLGSSVSDFSLTSVEGSCPSFQGFGLVIVNLGKVRRHFPTSSHYEASKSKQFFRHYLCHWARICLCPEVWLACGSHRLGFSEGLIQNYM